MDDRADSELGGHLEGRCQVVARPDLDARSAPSSRCRQASRGVDRRTRASERLDPGESDLGQPAHRAGKVLDQRLTYRVELDGEVRQRGHGEPLCHIVATSVTTTLTIRPRLVAHLYDAPRWTSHGAVGAAAPAGRRTASACCSCCSSGRSWPSDSPTNVGARPRWRAPARRPRRRVPRHQAAPRPPVARVAQPRRVSSSIVLAGHRGRHRQRHRRDRRRRRPRRPAASPSSTACCATNT